MSGTKPSGGTAPAARTWAYFVSYTAWDRRGQGFGNIGLELPAPVDSLVAVREIEKQIADRLDEPQRVVVLHYALLSKLGLDS